MNFDKVFISEEECLWRAVVCLGIRDALTPDEYLSNGNANPSPSRRDRERAIDWFKCNDFELVCEYSGSDGKTVRDVYYYFLGTNTLPDIPTIYARIYKSICPYSNTSKHRRGRNE